jgi:hypothetical protein
MADFSVTEIALIGNGATQTGRAIKVANCDKLSISFTLTASAGSLTTSTLALTGTNDDTRALDGSVTLPALTTGAAITALQSGVTYASNAITFTTAAAGTYEVTVTYSSFPKWVRPVWTFGSGGGTITSQVTVAAWSSST